MKWKKRNSPSGFQCNWNSTCAKCKYYHNSQFAQIEWHPNVRAPQKKVWARNIVTIWLDGERWMQPPTCLCILFMCIYINAAWKVTLFSNRTTANFPCSMFKAKPISEEKHTQKYQLNSCSTVKSHKYFLIRERSGSTVQNFIFTFPKIKWIISFGLSTMGHITQSNPNIPRRNIEIAIGMSN